MECPVTGRWWRRNVLSLVALCVLLPVTFGVVAVNEWSRWDVGHPTKPVAVGPGESTEYDAATIGPATAEFVDGDDSAPEGTRIVRASVAVAPGDEPIACITPLLRETEGAQRQWNEASAELDREYDPDLRTYCDSEGTDQYSLTLEYLVPEDATGPFAIEVAAPAELPHFVRLVVEP